MGRMLEALKRLEENADRSGTIFLPSDPVTPADPRERLPQSAVGDAAAAQGEDQGEVRPPAADDCGVDDIVVPTSRLRPSLEQLAAELSDEEDTPRRDPIVTVPLAELWQDCEPTLWPDSSNAAWADVSPGGYRSGEFPQEAVDLFLHAPAPEGNLGEPLDGALVWPSEHVDPGESPATGTSLPGGTEAASSRGPADTPPTVDQGVVPVGTDVTSPTEAAQAQCEQNPPSPAHARSRNEDSPTARPIIAGTHPPPAAPPAAELTSPRRGEDSSPVAPQPAVRQPVLSKDFVPRLTPVFFPPLPETLAVSGQFAELCQGVLEQVGGKEPVSLAFVHTGCESGTGIVVSKFAMTIAEAKLGPVLLIMSNVACGAAAPLFGLKDEPGLWALLQGQADWWGVIRPTDISGLHILPSGLAQPSSDHGIERRLSQLLNEAKAAYSYIVVDGGSSRDERTVALARHCDAAFMVVQIGKTPTAQARAATGKLQREGVSLRGCVATHIPVEDYASSTT